MKRFVRIKYAFLVSFLFAGLLIVGGTGQAQTAITGGNSFEAAATISAGDYTGGAIAEDTSQYFSITVGQGQLLTVRATLNQAVSSYGTLSSLVLYNSSREEVVNKFEANYSSMTLTDSWLVDSSQPTSQYFLMLASDDEGVSSYTMAVTLDNKFDAGSTVDAPSTFDNPVTLQAGTNAGHLGSGTEIGNDSTDMYVFTPTASGAYQITLTPPSSAQPILTIYDAQRQEVDVQYSANAGAIAKSTITADANSAVYVKVECDSCGTGLVDYTLALTPPTNTNTNTAVVNTNSVVSNTNAVLGNTNTTVGNVNASPTNTSAAVVNTNAAAVNANKDDSKSDGLSTTTLIIIGAGVVILLLVIIIVMVMRKKKGASTTPATPATPAPPAAPEKK